MMNYLKEIEFAMVNGFTEVETGVEVDGSVFFIGSFGYLIVNKEEAKEINDLISKYKKEKFEDEELTKKEKTVLNAIVEVSYEYGLGIESSDIDCKIKGKSLSGVISSLTKKGYLEGYLEGKSLGHDNFFNLSEKWFDKLVD